MIWKRDGFDYYHKSGKWKITANSGVSLHEKSSFGWRLFQYFSDVDQAKLWVAKQEKKR